MRRRPARKERFALRRLGRFLLVALLALLLAPTLVIAAYRFVDPPITPLTLIRLAEGEGLRKRWTPIERISPHLTQAVIAAEDNRFCRHNGFDAEALEEQIDAWLDGERPRGASTITMQTAKNILLWPERDALRKLIEAALTPQIEALWSKRRILEVYLNVVETGPGLYGAEAAARAYFGKPASALDPRQGALIAAALPNPRRWSPFRPTRYIERRASEIVKRVGQLGPLLDCAR